MKKKLKDWEEEFEAYVKWSEKCNEAAEKQYQKEQLRVDQLRRRYLKKKEEFEKLITIAHSTDKYEV